MNLGKISRKSYEVLKIGLQVISDIIEPGGLHSPWGLLQSSGVGLKSIWFASALPSIQTNCTLTIWRDWKRWLW